MILYVSCSWARSDASKDHLQSEFLQAAMSVWKAEKPLAGRGGENWGNFFFLIMILNLKWQQMRNYCLGFSANRSWAVSKLFHGTSENIFLTAEIVNVFRSKGVFGFGPDSQHESCLLTAAQAPGLGEWLRAWCGALCNCANDEAAGLDSTLLLRPWEQLRRSYKESKDVLGSEYIVRLMNWAWAG